MIGETLGSYRLVAKLGEGGMGAVYAAEHVVLGRRAAIKLLLPSLSSNQELVQRFFNEARATATLDHPGLVQVLDYGHTASGSAFLVMELLTGETIARRLHRAGRLDYASAAGFCRQAAAALAVAHAAGIVHRDLKPDNLFLVRDAEVALGERVKVLDFGIAKLTDPGAGVSSMTRTGAVFGTPWYMSPEQCRGAGEVDHRSDIYALGCILFEMVCGRPPFVGAGTGEIIGAHIFQDRPSPRAFDPAIPPALEAIIGRALQKDPAARQQSMQQLGAELEELAARLGAHAPAAPATGVGWQGGAVPIGFASTAVAGGPGHGAAVSPTTLGAAAGQPYGAAPGQPYGAAPGQPPRRRVAPMVIAGALGAAAVGVGVYVAIDRSEPAAGSASASASGAKVAKAEDEDEDETKDNDKDRPASARDRSSEPARVPEPERTPEAERAADAERATATAPAPDFPPRIDRPAPASEGSRATTLRGPRPIKKPAAPPPEPVAEAPAFAPQQRWSGHYVCAQGKTALTLRVTSARSHGVDAVFEFFHGGSGTSGSYRVSGPYDPGTRRLTLTPVAWIEQPPGYGMVGLSGSVSADGGTFAGLIRNSSCSTFTVRLR